MATATDVDTRVRKIISDELGIALAEDIRDEKKLVDDLGADSLDIIELVMVLEKEFDMDISDDDAVKLETVGEVVAYMRERTTTG